MRVPDRVEARIRALWLDRVRRRPTVYTDRDGLRYELRPGENAHAYFAHRGNYEVAETSFVRSWLRPGDTAIDVGANIGLYTLLFSKLVGPDGAVHAFEPDPENHDRLERNLRLNGVSNVAVTRAAVFRDLGVAQLHRFRSGLGPWTTLGRPELPDPATRGATARPVDAVEVEKITLDGYCEQEGLDRIRLLKVDVEGAEPDVLAGGAGMLARRAVEAVLFEISLPQILALGHRPAEAVELLGEAGYAVHVIRPDGRTGDTAREPLPAYANYVAFPS